MFFRNTNAVTYISLHIYIAKLILFLIHIFVIKWKLLRIKPIITENRIEYSCLHFFCGYPPIAMVVVAAVVDAAAGAASSSSLLECFPLWCFVGDRLSLNKKYFWWFDWSMNHQLCFTYFPVTKGNVSIADTNYNSWYPDPAQGFSQLRSGLGFHLLRSFQNKN